MSIFNRRLIRLFVILLILDTIVKVYGAAPRMFNHQLQSLPLLEVNGIYEIETDYDFKGETITLPQGTKIFFKGGSFINGCLKCGDNCEIYNGSFKDFEVDVRGNKNVIIKNSNFVYKREVATECALYINNSSYVEINNCSFDLADSLTSIKIIESNNVDVFNSNIDGGRDVGVYNRDNGGGIFVIYSSNRVNISNNRINNVGIGVAIQGLGSKEKELVSDVIVHGNTISDCRCYGIIAYYGTTTCTNIIITDNIVSNVTGQYNNVATKPAKSLGGGIYLQQVSNVICSGNYIKNTAIYTNNNSTLAPAGIAIATSTKCKVTNNIIEDSYQQGIILRGDYNVVSNNTINNSHDIPFEFRAGKGNIISGNHIISKTNIKGPSIYCFQHGNTNSLGLTTTIGDNIIESNVIVGRQTPIYCYKVDGVLQIKNNILSDFSGFGVEINNGNVIVTNNVMTSRIKTGCGISVGKAATGFARDNHIDVPGKMVSLSNPSNFKVY